MALQIRRGTNAQRATINFSQGELVYTTDTKKLYIGDQSTTGGVNVVQPTVGEGLAWNPVTEAIDVNPSGFNFTTNDLVEGTNHQFFTTARAAVAAKDMLVNGTHTGITYVWNGVSNTLDVTVTGSSSVVSDTSPTLGGNLSLNGHNITGMTGTSNISISGTITATTGLGADLSLNGHSIQGTGSLNVSGTLIATTGLGADLSLNSNNLIGPGNINIGGTIKADTGLGANLALNNHDITGTGNINITGTVLASGGLGGNLDLNNHNIIGTGGFNTTGNASITGIFTSTFVDLLDHSGVAGFRINTNYGGNSVTDVFDISSYHADSNPSGSFYTRGRGTFSSPASVNADDQIYNLGFSAITTDASTALAALINVSLDGAPGAGVAPGKLTIKTANASGTLVPALTIDHNQVLTVASNTLTAGGSSGQVDTSSVATYLKIIIGSTAYAIPAYAIHP